MDWKNVPSRRCRRPLLVRVRRPCKECDGAPHPADYDRHDDYYIKLNGE